MKTINDILREYTTGEATAEEANAALQEAGAGFHLEPGRNVLTEEDRRETVVGYYPEQANGWGLLDTGTGTLDKVHVVCGRLEHPVNEVLPDGLSTNCPAYVTICGRTYEAFGDKLAEIASRQEDAKKPPLPMKADLRRRTDLAGQTVRQHTKTGDYTVTYNEQGYAVKSVKIVEEGTCNA